jgi:hypothetical protein
MYKMTITELACAGADVRTIMLSSGLVQRDGITLSSGRFAEGVVLGVQGTGVGNGSWRSGLNGEGTPVSVDVKPIPTAVRVRPMADAHVPGSPPRGAPV